jgi:drug/metabolite transporter (DMT)-like permease
MSLFFFDQLSPAGFWGNISALGSGFSFGWLTLFLRRQKGGSGIESILLGNSLAAALRLAFMFGRMPDMQSWVGLFLLGTVQMGIPYVLFSVAVRHVPAVTAILVPMIEPVLNPVWVLLLLGESPTPIAMAGGAVILGTVATRCVADIYRFQRAGRPL